MKKLLTRPWWKGETEKEVLRSQQNHGEALPLTFQDELTLCWISTSRKVILFTGWSSWEGSFLFGSSSSKSNPAVPTIKSNKNNLKKNSINQPQNLHQTTQNKLYEKQHAKLMKLAQVLQKRQKKATLQKRPKNHSHHQSTFLLTLQPTMSSLFTSKSRLLRSPRPRRGRHSRRPEARGLGAAAGLAVFDGGPGVGDATEPKRGFLFGDQVFNLSTSKK